MDQREAKHYFHVKRKLDVRMKGIGASDQPHRCKHHHFIVARVSSLNSFNNTVLAPKSNYHISVAKSNTLISILSDTSIPSL